MTLRNIYMTFVFVLVAGSVIFVDSGQAQVTYTISGIVSGIEVPDAPVEEGEYYTAVFEIDESVLDSDPASNRGEYLGAIFSSSITFSGGYISTVDFSGGDVVVLKDSSGHGIFLTNGSTNATPSGAFALYSLEQFSDGIDSLLTSPQEVASLPGALWVLFETDGSSVSSISTGEREMALSVVSTAPPEPLLGDVNQDGSFDFLDIGPFISVMESGAYLDEADINRNGIVDFFDVQPFVSLLVSLRGD